MTLSLWLVLAHYIGDFRLQDDWMALNKSKRWDALAAHVSVYSACFVPWGWRFVLAVWITHFITDAITSRLTSKLWFIDLFPVRDYASINAGCDREVFLPGDMIAAPRFELRHAFFEMIGRDQLVHYITLAILAAWLVR